ncbi:MAG: hypothetical protein ACI4S2_10960, partial [Lachnospiraceae bacterium]
KFEEKYLRKGFMDKISVIRILDSRRENFRVDEKLGRRKTNMIKILFICHGKKLLFWKNVGESRVVGV